MQPVLPTVVMADDHALVAEGIGKLLEGNFRLLCKVGGAAALCEAARELEPDLILADISMPDMSGIDAARLILKDNPRARIVFVTQHSDPQYARAAIAAGAAGYILKQSASSELLTGLREVLAGRTYISPSIPPESLKSTASDPLTGRQREVLRL